MTTTAERMRAWTGPAILTFGFRPFFLGAALWAALAMVLWLAMLAGRLDLPAAFDPVSWHAHEFLFGYLGAVMAGFLFTAVPNWTGRLPIVGWPLAGVFALWLAGRLAVTLPLGLPPLAVALADLAFPLVFALLIAIEIVAGRNWRNLVVLGLLSVFALGNAVFHVEAASGGFPAQGAGTRIGLGAAILLIGVIGGRIVPSFTRNWLVQRGPGRLPVPPMQDFDKLALAVLAAALLCWIAAPQGTLAGIALALTGVLHLIRLARWAGDRTAAEPLVLVLHLGYAFLPLGALVMALEILLPDLLTGAGGQHLWMAGGIGLMTMAVMTRASLGHTGQPLTANRGTRLIYGALLVAILSRLAAALLPGQADLLLKLAGLAWIAGFGGFGLVYGPQLLRHRKDRKG